MLDEDIRLARRLKKKDEKVLEKIMKRFTPLVATIIYNISRGTLTAEDIEETVIDVSRETFLFGKRNICTNQILCIIMCISKNQSNGEW